MITKFGLFEYNTENIGDEVQSLAARRFLPRVDYYFDRDNIDGTQIGKDEVVKLIMNGWYTHHPENWPPKNSAIEPLLVSMHVEQDALNGEAAKAFSSAGSVEFLNTFGPVGARNYPTMEFLNSIGVESYFAGCITLTLNPADGVKKRDYILAVDVSDEVLKKIKSKTKRPVYAINTNRKKKLDRETRFLVSKFWLYLYQSAHFVVTTRLHTMLPCIALGTPVIAISGRDPKRYAGLIDLTNHMTEKEFLTKRIDYDHPAKNPTLYKKMRATLEEKCTSFTGFDSHASYLGEMRVTDLLSDTRLAQFFLDAAYDTWLSEEYQQKCIELQGELDAIGVLGVKDSARSLLSALRRKLS